MLTGETEAAVKDRGEDCVRDKVAAWREAASAGVCSPGHWFTTPPGKMCRIEILMAKPGVSKIQGSSAFVRNSLEVAAVAARMAGGDPDCVWQATESDTNRRLCGPMIGDARPARSVVDAQLSGLTLAERVDHVIRSLTDDTWHLWPEWTPGPLMLEPWVSVFLYDTAAGSPYRMTLVGGEQARIAEITAAVEWELRARGVGPRQAEEVGLA